LGQPWVAQNVTFRFETTCNRYISPDRVSSNALPVTE